MRSYFLCQNCELIFVPRNQLIPEIKEKERYELHQNAESDPYYQDYLSQILISVLPLIEKNQVGLDFGCGRTTLLAQLFSQKGIEVDSFDYYFLKDETIWNKKYDFIVLSEVIEHLRDPFEEMKSLKNILNPNGKMFIKTKFYPQKSEFDQWFYKRDLTHIQFFNPQSMEHLGHSLQMKSEFYLNGPDLTLFRKL
ncbi:MAG: class I SAM-dependent methyltransferase [Bacteriovoracaceae bacterium]